MFKALLADLDIRVQAVVELVTLCSRKKNHSVTILPFSSVWLQAKYTKILENFTK